MRESRIVLPPNAGVAELADALDSKAGATLWSDRPIDALLTLTTTARACFTGSRKNRF
jgi:hypothetical protein